MEANVYRTDGSVEKKIALPATFNEAYNEDVVKRALLAEQSMRYQPQGHYLRAGINTSAEYVGRYGTYRTQRHTGLAPRPRQKLAKGGMGAVRRIPSAVKGKRAHPHMVEKIIVERINRKEYIKALSSAIAATGNASLVKKNHVYQKEGLPILVSSDIEKISKTKPLIKVLESLGVMDDVEKSHGPKTREGRRRRVQKRYFRSSILIVAKDANNVGKAGRNIPGVDVLGVEGMRVEILAPGAKPRLTIWTEAALQELQEGITKSSINYKK